jgi:hypothetical protein
VHSARFVDIAGRDPIVGLNGARNLERARLE